MKGKSGGVKASTAVRAKARRILSSRIGGFGSITQMLDGLPIGPPKFVAPMQCRLSDRIPEGEKWVYEIKFDGYRGLALKNGDAVRLISRNQKDLSSEFPDVVRALRALPVGQLALDGELVALDDAGRSSFQMLQGHGHRNRAARLYFYIFDILNLDGKITTGLPLMERKSIVRNLFKGRPGNLRLSDVFDVSPAKLTALLKPLGVEGLIAKQRDSMYEPGLRTGSWIKVKWGFQQEFVIGGYTAPEGSRPYFGAALVGYYDGPNLIFAGKVGTGFDTRQLKALFDQFKRIRTANPPFTNLPERDGVINRAQMRFCKWVQPRLVCQVRFTEWTLDGHLRHPVFLGLRKDKNPREIVKEMPATNQFKDESGREPR